MARTIPAVTQYMDDYFSARPQIEAPDKTLLGYDVPYGIACLLQSMLQEIEHFQHEATPGRKLIGKAFIESVNSIRDSETGETPSEKNRRELNELQEKHGLRDFRV